MHPRRAVPLPGGASLVAGGAAAGLPVLFTTMLPRATADLASLVSVVLVHRLADPATADFLAARIGTKLVPAGWSAREWTATVPPAAGMGQAGVFQPAAAVQPGMAVLPNGLMQPGGVMPPTAVMPPAAALPSAAAMGYAGFFQPPAAMSPGAVMHPGAAVQPGVAVPLNGPMQPVAALPHVGAMPQAASARCLAAGLVPPRQCRPGRCCLSGRRVRPHG